MPIRWALLTLALVAGTSWLLTPLPSSSAEPAGYSPIVLASVVHSAVQSNLNLVRHWLDEKDFQSAHEAIRGLAMVVELYSYQSAEPEWRKKLSGFQAACAQLAVAIGRKSAPDSEKALAECSRQLEVIGKAPPTGAKVVAMNFKPFGSVKTWMLLMEGAYVDAKRAETGKEFDQLAQAIAEEANVARYLRSDAKWRTSADEVRDTALKAAKLAEGNDLPAAKKMLKQMYQRCEACHQRDKK